MDRRTFVKGAAAASAGAFAFGPGLFDGARAGAQEDGSVQRAEPNILVIKVDEMRFPSVFPSGVSGPGDFLKTFMPNLYQLWQNGVKFTSHYTAACACTPSRGTIITGLYSQQSWLVQTITAPPGQQISLQPWLNPAYPTYGKLLRRAGYQTPYVGKWHVSIPPQYAPRLEAYGFDGLTWPDPVGANLQGSTGDYSHYYTNRVTGEQVYAPFRNDADVATQGAGWLQQHGAGGEAPWCLTVSFVNPHDQEFFWAGTEFQTYDGLFASDGRYDPFTYYSYNPVANTPPLVSWDQDPLKSPPSFGYPALPPNWESTAQMKANKPSRQISVRVFQGAVWGDVADDSSQQGFTVVAYPPAPDGFSPTICGKYTGKPLGIGTAPYSYWQRSQDCYTLSMQTVDGAIGTMLKAFGSLPSAVQQNTVIVFMSDHGDYAGAHGFVAGKVGSIYEEAFHVPFIVVDPSGRFTGDIDAPRQGLTSSVDLLPLLVSLGHGGGRDWLRGNLGQIYAERHDLLPMLRSSQAAGRDYVLLATDEAAPAFYNFNNSPPHIVGLRTQELKFGLYANWQGVTSQIADDDTLETELYDYSTAAGQAELDNISNSNPSDPRIPALKQTLLNNLIPNVLRAPLPRRLGVAQTASQAAYLAYSALLRNLPNNSCGNSSSAGDLAGILPFGQDF